MALERAIAADTAHAEANAGWMWRRERAWPGSAPALKKRKRRSQLAEGKTPSRFSKRQAVLAKAASGNRADKQ